MAKLILVRGLPGSGKSTLAKSMSGFTHIETDMYFMENGEFKFDAKNLSQAHSLCLFDTISALHRGENVVVSNTFVCLWEMSAYKSLGYPCETITATGTFENIHNVPNALIDRMKAKWQPEPSQDLYPDGGSTLPFVKKDFHAYTQ